MRLNNPALSVGDNPTTPSFYFEAGVATSSRAFKSSKHDCYVKEEVSSYSKVYNSNCPMDFNPDYMTLLEVEQSHNYENWRLWMWNHWHWSLYASAIYLCLVFGGRQFMKNREPFKLSGVLIFWNILLAIFSAVGFLRLFPEIAVSLFRDNGGFYSSVCFMNNLCIASAFWGLLFTWSKIFEFGDTAFIILRKQPLLFLHWYHHVSVCLYCWFTHATYDPASRWFVAMNFFVHAFMYFYYSLRACKVKIPRGFAKTLTFLQILQMVVGVIINVHSYRIKVNGGECNRPMRNIYAALGMYTSYFALFCQFFYNAYVKNTMKSKLE